MSELAATTDLPRAPALRRAAGVGAGALGLVLLGAGLARALNGLEVSGALALAGGAVLVGFLLLAIRRYDAAVAIGLALEGIVRFQPAPTDIAFAVIMCVAAVTGRFHLGRVPALLRWLIALLLAVNLVSMLDVVSISEAVQFLFITVYLAVFALWLTAYLDRPSRSRLVVVTWLAVGVISAVVSILALNLPLPGRSFILGTVDDGQRASGLFKDPNVFGPFLVPITLIVLELRIAPKMPRLLRMRAATTWLALLALSLGVLFSYSRAAWANLAIGVVVMLLALSMRRRGAQRALRALAGLLLICGVAVVILSATGSIALVEERARLQSYDTQRFAAQTLGWQLGWTHPVGIGPGQFGHYSLVEAHSLFVRAFAEQGFLGLGLLIALLLSTFVMALRNVVLGRDTYGIGSAALLGAWSGLIFNSVVVDTMHWRHLWFVLALIWAGAARGALSGSESAQASVSRMLGGRWPPRGGGARRTFVQRGRASVPSR